MLASPPNAAPIFNEVLGQGLGDQMFYRQPNGWITSGPIGKANSRKHAYRDQGWEPLDAYGRFDLIDYYVDHPLEVLLIRGGAEELPIEQVVALGWHLRPPTLPRCGVQLGADHKNRVNRPKHYQLCWDGAQPAVFPQLEGQEFESPSPCEYCDRDDFATDKARSQHIRVLHRDEVKEIATAREMAKGMQEAVLLGLNGGAAASKVTPGLSKYACGICGEPADTVKALGEHVKLHDDD